MFDKNFFPSNLNCLNGKETANYLNAQMQLLKTNLSAVKPSRHSSVGRAHVCLWHNGSEFQVPPICAHSYMEEIGSAAMLAAKGLAGVTPEVNFRECVTCMPPTNNNNAAHSSFETQRRHHQKFKSRVSVAPQKGLMSSKN